MASSHDTASRLRRPQSASPHQMRTRALAVVQPSTKQPLPTTTYGFLKAQPLSAMEPDEPSQPAPTEKLAELPTEAEVEVPSRPRSRKNSTASLILTIDEGAPVGNVSPLMQGLVEVEAPPPPKKEEDKPTLLWTKAEKLNRTQSMSAMRRIVKAADNAVAGLPLDMRESLDYLIHDGNFQGVVHLLKASELEFVLGPLLEDLFRKNPDTASNFAMSICQIQTDELDAPMLVETERVVNMFMSRNIGFGMVGLKTDAGRYLVAACLPREADNDAIELSTRHKLWEAQAEYVVRRCNPLLWDHLLRPDNRSLRPFLSQLPAAIKEHGDKAKCSLCVSALVAQGHIEDCIMVLETMLLGHGMPDDVVECTKFQNCLILCSLKTENSKSLLRYIKRLKHFDVEVIGQMCEDLCFLKEAFECYKKAGLQLRALELMLAHHRELGGPDSAKEFAAGSSEEAQDRMRQWTRRRELKEQLFVLLKRGKNLSAVNLILDNPDDLGGLEQAKEYAKEFGTIALYRVQEWEATHAPPPSDPPLDADGKPIPRPKPSETLRKVTKGVVARPWNPNVWPFPRYLTRPKSAAP